MKNEQQKFLTETIFLAKRFLSSLPEGWLNHALGDVQALNDFYINVAKIEAEQKEIQKSREEIEKIKNIRLDNIKMSVRCYNHLHYINGIDTLGDLANLSEIDILKMPNLGRKSLNELRQILIDHNLQFSKYKGIFDI